MNTKAVHDQAAVERTYVSYVFDVVVLMPCQVDHTISKYDSKVEASHS